MSRLSPPPRGASALGRTFFAMNCEQSDVIFLRRLSNKGGQLLLNVFYQITCGMKRSVKQLVKTLMAE